MMLVVTHNTVDMVSNTQTQISYAQGSIVHNSLYMLNIVAVGQPCVLYRTCRHCYLTHLYTEPLLLHQCSCTDVHGFNFVTHTRA